MIENSLNSIDELPQKVEHLVGRIWAVEALLLSVCEALPQEILAVAHRLFERETSSLRERIPIPSGGNSWIAVQSFESKVRQISALMS